MNRFPKSENDYHRKWLQAAPTVYVNETNGSKSPVSEEKTVLATDRIEQLADGATATAARGHQMSRKSGWDVERYACSKDGGDGRWPSVLFSNGYRWATRLHLVHLRLRNRPIQTIGSMVNKPIALTTVYPMICSKSACTMIKGPAGSR